MRYTSLTPAERQEMLRVIGLERVQQLFDCIPQNLKLKAPLKLSEAIPETDILHLFNSLAQRNTSADRFTYFLGAGAYHHFIPTVVDTLVSRSEFYTAYTPYQPEISQGTLQTAFEYQSLLCQLTGLEVANSSLYDGASALAEGVLMAARVTRRRKVLLPANLHPEYRRVVNTYVANLEIELIEVPFTQQGSLDLDQLEKLLTSDCATVVVQSPNFFGTIEPLEEISRLARDAGVLVLAAVAEAISLGILKPPGELGADIVVGEAQSFGIPLGFGGPYLGFFATRDRYKRQMPGRLVGQTVDSQGNRGFVLTLATREQHIRREKATSNICTNQGLCALMATIFLCTLGKQGIRELAEHNLKKSHYLRRQLQDEVVFSGPSFNEFVIRCPANPHEINRRLWKEGIVGGLPLGQYFPDRPDQMLVCVTEANRRETIDRFARAVQTVKVA